MYFALSFNYGNEGQKDDIQLKAAILTKSSALRLRTFNQNWHLDRVLLSIDLFNIYTG
jgi:hypothetical protein